MHLVRHRNTTIEREVESDRESDFHSNPEEGTTWPLAVKVSRTTVHLLDYKMFIAARRIQSYWRGHRARKQLHQRWQAAITIQRWWRGFRTRHNLWELLERRLQDTLLEHFRRAAIVIQALFRGWRDRRYIHNVRNLRRMQSSAAEDLLNCVILQLKHMKRTGSLPGILSLRNSHCLSKVEKLMNTMLYRFHNNRVFSMVASTISQKEVNRRYFESSLFYTQFPYAGPNFNELCPFTDEEKLVVKDLPIDLRYAKIFAEYEESQLDSNLKKSHRRSVDRKRQKHMDKIINQEMLAKRKFCEDVKERMQKWKIWL
uniref:Uncharacterized protein LOC108043760 isoform X1 n=1 Tax=Drosophila rhopaloa TaxID=1041015 RepID=A0A6P4EN75_DRORH